MAFIDKLLLRHGNAEHAELVDGAMSGLERSASTATILLDRARAPEAAKSYRPRSRGIVVTSTPRDSMTRTRVKEYAAASTRSRTELHFLIFRPAFDIKNWRRPNPRPHKRLFVTPTARLMAQKAFDACAKITTGPGEAVTTGPGRSYGGSGENRHIG